jgi:flavodoxin
LVKRIIYPPFISHAMKVLVVYYSKTGNNRFLAERFARGLKADIEEIHPRMGAMFFQIFFSLFKAGFGIRTLEHDVSSYDRIVLIGPVWMGNFIYPLRKFYGRYEKGIQKVFFATSCGGKDAEKDTKFGYGRVFKKAGDLMGSKLVGCEAFPTDLVIPPDRKEDKDYMMKARLDNDNFKGEILSRFERTVERIRKG